MTLKSVLMMTLKKFHSDCTKKVTKYTPFIGQVLKCIKKVKNILD